MEYTAARAAVELSKLGFTKVYTFTGGYNGWVKAGYPVETKAVVSAKNCVACHTAITPGVVSDWKLSRHSQKGVDCAVCHGDAHFSPETVHLAQVPTPERCAYCHGTQVKQFMGGKHAKGWASMKAMPTFHMQPMAMMEGMKGCGGCHKIGVKTEQEIKDLRKNQGGQFGVASCDSCHTRHVFSKKEALQPQACQTCHMGFDHAQWEMYSTSKHGVRYGLKQLGVLPETAVAPTCQSCHMANGHHGVKTAWGFVAVRLPLPADPKWAADRTSVLKGLGALDPSGKETPRLSALKNLDVFRATEADWQQERDRMTNNCRQCHSPNFVNAELGKSDSMIRESDRLMAEALEVVAGLYRDKILKKPAHFVYSYPDLLAFHDAPTLIEQKLYMMFSEHRMRTFQGSFHANPDYAFWYGWSRMVSDLTEIREMAADLRSRKGKKGR